MSLIKIIIRGLAYLTYLLITSAILIEITFRILPTTSPIDLQITSDKSDILRFKANQKSTLSLGKNFYQNVKKRTNNYGFYSNFDYFPNSKPDIAIIGDSMVEAAQIKNEDSIGEVIQLKSDLNVYQFGVSGVPLSQYIQMIKFAKREFSPKHFAIVVVGNDFDESLCSFRIKEGTWCFDDNLELKFNPFYGYQGLRKIARKSAAIRYLVFHVGFDWRGALVQLGLKDPGLSTYSKYAGNTERLKSNEIIIASQRVIAAFYSEIIKMDLAGRLTIIIDADRRDIYKNIVTKSYFNDMREIMIKMAVAKNINYIDMNDVFRNDFKILKKKFEFPTDGHWNEHAHKLVAQELLKQVLPTTK